MSLREKIVQGVSRRVWWKTGILSLPFRKRRILNFDSEQIRVSAKTSGRNSPFDAFEYDKGLHWGKTAAENKTFIIIYFPTVLTQ